MHEARPDSRGWRPPRWSIVAALVAASIVALAAVFDWNWFKGPIERRVSTATGREFQINGDLDVDLGRVITATAEQLTLGNPSWSAHKEMGRADRVRIDVALWPLLRGKRVLRRIEILRPRLLLERNAAGAANWRFDAPRRSERRRTRPTYLGEVFVSKGVLELHDDVRQTDLLLDVDSAVPGAGTAPLALVARGAGRHRDGRLELAGRIDSPALLASGGYYRVDVRARAGDTRAHVSGQVRVPVDVRRFTVRASIEGEDLADLYPLLGIATPETPPYALVGLLSRDGNVIRYRDFKGTVGDSDLSGDIRVRLGEARPTASGRLVSRRLDFDDLAGLVGAPPSTKPGESASPEQKTEAMRRASRPQVLPDRPYDLEKLRSMDADIRFSAARVDAGKLPIESIVAKVRLDDGMLKLDPLDLGVAGGRLTGSVRLDARRNPIQTTADLRAWEVALPKLFPRTIPDSVGLLAGAMSLRGHGNSVADMFATADGELGVVMGRGRFSNLLLELAGLDVAESLKFLLGKDRTVPLRCAYADFDVDDGIMKTEALAFDTTDTVVLGEGKLDLRKESLDLELTPQPKDWSPVSLRVPLEVGGTFKDPSFAPKPGPLAARTAAAASLFSIAPPAALLALIETGPGENADCGGEPLRREKDEHPKREMDPPRERSRWKDPAGRDGQS